VTVFTTGPDGVHAKVHAGLPIGASPDDYLKASYGVLQIQRDVKPGDLGRVDVTEGQLFYIARADEMLTERTIRVHFDWVP
jgi:hypothetical protein